MTIHPAQAAAHNALATSLLSQALYRMECTAQLLLDTVHAPADRAAFEAATAIHTLIEIASMQLAVLKERQPALDAAAMAAAPMPADETPTIALTTPNGTN